MSPTECMPWVKAHVARTIALWNECAACPPVPSALYSRPEQKQREQAYDVGVRSVEDELKTRPLTESGRAIQQDKLIASFGRFATTALGLEDDAVHMITRE